MDKERKEHVELSWRIIEAKIMYYQPGELGEAFVQKYMPTDADFDAMEQRYLELCDKLNLPNTVSHKDGNGMMEVDWDRPSVKLAHSKLLRFKDLDRRNRSRGR